MEILEPMQQDCSDNNNEAREAQLEVCETDEVEVLKKKTNDKEISSNRKSDQAETVQSTTIDSSSTKKVWDNCKYKMPEMYF